MVMRVSVETGAAARKVIAVLFAVALGLGAAVVIDQARADEEPDLMSGWYVYDYRAGLDVEPAVNVFEPAVEHDGAVWANHRQWSIDDPESPPSILALVRYDRWDHNERGAVTTGTPGTDLRQGCVRFELRGDRLDLKGARVTFWIMAYAEGERWHTDLPVITDDWQSYTVRAPDMEWRNSWRADPSDPPEIGAVLAQANSYGIGMVGFGDEEPTGTIGMRRFEIGCLGRFVGR